MFLVKAVARRSFVRTMQTLPPQSNKPKFDPVHFEESIKPYAEDVTVENQYSKLVDMILPLANHPYDQQLQIKQSIVEQAFDQIGNAILWDKRIDKQVLKYVEFREGHFCQVKPIVPSPTIEQYRSRDDFSCGHDVDGQKTLGFYVNPRNSKKFGNALCVSPLHLKSMKPKHLLAVKHFNQFLKQHPLPVCTNANVLKKDQYWRSVSLRSNERDQLMMIVVVHPQSLSKNEIDQLKKDLRDYFIDGAGRECELNSIYFQTCAHSRCTSEDNPFELLHGDEFLYETYNGKRFRISPESFVQVNKRAAELLYAGTLEHAQLDENTILLDIGSGIGVHSIMASTMAKKVYAIDPLQLCVEDGRFNAKLNACKDNIEWICGSAETNLHRVLKKIADLHGDSARLVAIVTPSRYGLTNKTIALLRNLSAIRQIVYSLSKVDQQVMHNFYELAAGQRSKLKETGRPLLPTDVYPLDLLPHTTHTETLVKCVRV